MLNSNYRPLGPVELPAMMGRQFYMHGFDIANPKMPKGFEDYREPVVSLCKAAGAHEGTAYMTIDEKIVGAGMSQRRPGPHVDGCFMPALSRWGGGGWAHGCNRVPFERMPVIVAASVAGCKVFEGQFNGEPTDTGDVAHFSDQLPEGTVVPANEGFVLSPDCVHESMIFDEPTPRTFLRIALPTDFKIDNLL